MNLLSENIYLNLTILALIGGIEWWLAMLRTRACAQGRRNLLFLLVLVEQSLALLVLASLVAFLKQDNGLLPIIIYSLGGAIGSWFSIPRAINDCIKKNNYISEDDL